MMTKKKKPKLQPQIIQGGINIKGNAVIKNSKVAGRDNVEKKITNISYSFAPVYHAIEKSPNITPETQKAVEQSVKEIEHEVKKGSKARGTFIQQRLENILNMAPDIAEVAIATMLNPRTGLSLAVKKVVTKFQAEKAKKEVDGSAQTT
jgi:DNA topoisomerase VI subunit B